MQYGFVTDELHASPRQAIELGVSWGIRHYEIRNVHGKRFPRVDDAIFDELAALRDEFEIEYTAVSPGFFKCHIEDSAETGYALGEGLSRCLAFMKRCHVPLLVCFGFELDTGTDEEAVAKLAELADRSAGQGVKVAVENETHCKFNTPERIARLTREVDRSNFGVNWDLANLQEGAAEGYPAGYELVRPLIFNVHVKDWALVDGKPAWKPVGEGVCDWPGQMRALVRDRIVDRVTIENHCGPLEEVGRHNLLTLQEYVRNTSA